MICPRAELSGEINKKSLSESAIKILLEAQELYQIPVLFVFIGKNCIMQSVFRR